MRQRKIKNQEEKLANYKGVLLDSPMDYKGKWNELFCNDNPICLELGCGKGRFINTLASTNSQINYIGIEGQHSVILRALEKREMHINEKNLSMSNLFFIGIFIKNIEDYFEINELSGLYLNFSDPWPKDRHSKRRLTHSGFLAGYKKVLKSGAFIEFKSDNDKLFQFTVNEFKDNDLLVEELSEDLHNSMYSSKHVTTEYEEKFKSLGKNINYCRCIVNK